MSDFESDPIEWPTSQDEVDEFTDTGILIPYQEFLNCDGYLPTWALGDTMEDRVAAEIFQRNNSDTTLVHVIALGVETWVICRTRRAYLRFGRDWIGRLVELNREDAIPDFTEAMDDFLTEAVQGWSEAWLRALPQPPASGKRSQRGSQPHRKRAPEQASGPSTEGSSQ